MYKDYERDFEFQNNMFRIQELLSDNQIVNKPDLFIFPKKM